MNDPFCAELQSVIQDFDQSLVDQNTAFSGRGQYHRSQFAMRASNDVVLVVVGILPSQQLGWEGNNQLELRYDLAGIFKVVPDPLQSSFRSSFGAETALITLVEDLRRSVYRVRDEIKVSPKEKTACKFEATVAQQPCISVRSGGLKGTDQSSFAYKQGVMYLSGRV